MINGFTPLSHVIKKRAKKQSLDKITEYEFYRILEIVGKKRDSYAQSRRVMALALLYTSGLKTREIVTLSIAEVRDFFNGKPICRKVDGLDWCEQSSISVSLTVPGLRFLKKYHSCFLAISDGKQDTSYVFSSADNFEKPISLSFFERELSELLKVCSVEIKKTVKLHNLCPAAQLFSFRFC